jgi:DNA-binding beta-propeller fold protein YncE
MIRTAAGTVVWVGRSKYFLVGFSVLWALLVGLVSLLLFAHAATGTTVESLKQLPLPQGCLDQSGGGGCGDVSAPMANVGEPAISPDGLHVYVPGRDSDSLNVFDRNPTTGVLTEKTCLRFTAAAGCTTLPLSPLEDATGAAVSADGKSLYVVGGASGGTAPDGIITFSLAADGTPLYEQCFNSNGSGGCTAAPAFAGPTSVAVSPDGTSVYVANYDGSSINVFKRNTSNGYLNQTGLSATEKCFSNNGFGGCSVLPQLEFPRDIEVTPDSKQVIVPSSGCFNAVSAGCFSLLALDRNASTSVLSTQIGNQGCVSFDMKLGSCQVRNYFYAPTQIAISNDGQTIYAAMRAGSCCNVSALMLVQRNPSTGDLMPRADWCAEYPGSASDCPVDAKALNDPFDVALSPDGTNIYTTGYGGQRVGAFDRTSTGTATQKPGASGCLAASSQADSCGGTLQQGGNVEYVLPSPDGRHVYAMGQAKIFTISVDRPPTCQPVNALTRMNMAVTVQLDCSDQNGDSLTYDIMRHPAKGSLGAVQPDGTVTYGPFLGTTGTDSFDYRASAAGEQSNTATVTITVDGTRPTVTTVTPANRATRIAPTTNVFATFSEQMQASTITKSTFKLVRKGTSKAVPAKVTYSDSLKKATLNPGNSLVRNATYVATVTTGTKDLAGNPLAQNKTWSFTVR